MNLISNCCLGAFLYQKYGLEFSNPFMWCMLSITDMITLMTNYEKIDFNNYKIELDTYKLNPYKTYMLNLDNYLQIHYVHYIEDKNYKIPTKRNDDVLYCDAVNYLETKYKNRLNRMLNDNEEPVFVMYCEQPYRYLYDKENIIKFIKTETKYKKILLTPFPEHKQYENEKLKVIIIKFGRQPWEDIVEKHNKEIKDFVEKDMNKQIIVSLTSFGERLKVCSKAIYTILNNSYKNIKVVLTLYKEDIDKIPEDLKILVDNNLVEILIADKNLGPHLKYFYVMKKYKEYPILTIDDDSLYDVNTIKTLLEHYDGKSVISLWGHELNKNLIYAASLQATTNSINHKNIALGGGGVLYPENVFDNFEPNEDEIIKIFHNDDIYLKVLEFRNNVPVKILNKKMFNDIITKETVSFALKNENYNGRTQTEMNHFNKELRKIFE